MSIFLAYSPKEEKMKKNDILDFLKKTNSGTKIRIEFNIGSSGSKGAVEGILEKNDNNYSE